MAKRYIYLIRHGQYDLTGREKGELTDAGHEQALLTGHSLREVPFSSITSSTVVRAVQTAQIIAEMFPGLPLYQDEDLCECIPAVPADYEDYFRRFFPEHTPERITNCTSTLTSAFGAYFVPPEPGEGDVYDMIVCHGNVIRFFISQVLQPASRFWLRFQINHCGISRVSVDSEGQATVISHNDTGHLPPDLLTEN